VTASQPGRRDDDQAQQLPDGQALDAPGDDFNPRADPLKSDADLADLAERQALQGFRWAGGLGWHVYDQDSGAWSPVSENVVANRVKEFMQAMRVRCLEDELQAIGLGRDGKVHSDLAAAWASRSNAGRIFQIERLERGVCHASPGDFDRHRDLLNCRNGVLDLRTLDLLPHDPRYFFTKTTGVDYVPGARHPDITQALEAIPAEVRGYAQLRYGQALTGYTPPDDGVCVHYGSGANGKGAIMAAVLRAVGGYGALLPAQLLLADPRAHTTDLMTLRGVRVGYVDELPEEGQLSVQRIKVLSAPEITARHIRQDNVTFRNECSAFINTNYRPQVRETDLGTWRRLGVSWPYPYTFRKGHEGLPSASDRRGDPTLRQRVETDPDGARARAMLAWLAEGARRWYAGEPGRPERTMGEPPQLVRDFVDDWREACDLVYKFIRDALDFDPGAHVLATELFGEFRSWAQAHGHREWTDATLAARFEVHSECQSHNVTKGRVRSNATQGSPSRPSGAYQSTLPDQYTAWFGVRFRAAQNTKQQVVQGVQGFFGSPTFTASRKDYGRPLHTLHSPSLEYDWLALWNLADHNA
jgi:P4 family phage/plasmid primase-like protien